MRIALISDIHANEVALHAVLDDMEQVGVDRMACLGDVATLGPAPGAVLQTLQALGCPCIMGNHDAFLLDPPLIHTYTESPRVIAAVDWCRSQLSGKALDFVRTFQPHLEISLDAQRTLLLFHGSPRSHMDIILSTTSPDELDRLLAGHNAPVMAGGHTHIQMLRQHRGLLIVNPGSAGQAFKEFVAGKPPTLLAHAEYATVEATQRGIAVALRRVPLNKNALREAAGACDSPLQDWLLQQYA
jgi:putative phosphoesterase